MSEGALRGLETQWHKIYIGWHAILGQLKVKQRAEETKISGAGKNNPAALTGIAISPSFGQASPSC